MSGPQNCSNRWQPRLFAGGTPVPPVVGSALLAVPNIAALIALPTATIDDGGVVSVKTVMGTWILDKTSVAATDGITVVPATGGGRWFRMDSVAEIWLIQPTWHIDPTIGNDENFGTTALAPLATHAELMRRINGNVVAPSTVTVYLDSAITEVIEADWKDAGDTQIFYQGVRTVLYSGSVTGVVPYNPAASVDGQITDAAIPVSWTASGLVGKHFVITRGTNAGAVGVIAKDMGAKTARYSPMDQPFGYAALDPSVFDAFDVYDVTQVKAFVSNGTATINLVDVELVGPGVWGGYTLLQHGGVVTCNSVTISGGTWVDGDERLFRWTTRFDGTTYLQLTSSSLLLFACELEDYIDMSENRGAIVVVVSSISQYTPAAVYGRVGGDKVDIEDAWGIFDNPVGTDCNYRALVGTLQNSGACRLRGLLWGTGNSALFGVRVQGGGTIVYDTLPTVGPGVFADSIIGDVQRTYAEWPVADLNKSASAVMR